MKSKMKAFVCRGPKQFSLEDVEIGEPEIGEVKLRVLYAGICGSDLSIVHGRNPFASYPLIPGHEFVGEVVESKDASFQAGQLAAVMPVVGCGECESCQLGNVNRCRKVKLYGVHMNGGFAEYVLVKAKNLIPFEEPIQPSQVVFSEPLAVGVHANRINGTNPKDSIAIIGGGIIGSVILKGAKVLGAKSITVIDVIAERLERSLRLGAQDVINSSQHDLRELIKNQHYVGRYDSVFDVVGNDETLDITIGCNKSNSPFNIVNSLLDLF
jgi:L-gulonate 5-dehydrogenase